MLGCERVEVLGVVGEANETGGAAGEPGLVVDEPRLVSSLSDPDARDTDPSFTEDLRELYFMSDRTGHKEIWRSLRPAASDPWGTPELVPELNGTSGGENPFVSNDGLSIWFFTDRDRSLGSIWHSTRAARSAPWEPPEPRSELALTTGSSDVCVAVNSAETLFVLNAKPPGAPPYGMYRMERTMPDEPLSAPELIDEIVSASNDFDPDMRRDGLFLAFESQRETENTQIFWTLRADRSEPFRTPVRVPALISIEEDNACAFSEDLRYVMFSSFRTGNSEIFEAILSTPLE